LTRLAKGETTLADVRRKANERKIKRRTKQSMFRNIDDDGEMPLGPQKSLVYECIKENERWMRAEAESR
jgi:hypothetical protein